MGKRTAAAFTALLLIMLAAILPFCGSENGVPAAAEPYRGKFIIIDAGHGGFDGGAVASDGTIEKDINLDIALRLDAILRAAGYSTVLVRNGDTSTEDSGSSIRSKKVSDIKNRLKLMEKYGESIFVSVHMNKYSTTQPHGAQVFYSPYGTSKELAECIQSSICENVQPDNKRTVKKSTDDIYLLHNATAPAVIAECGFLSNPSDLANFKDDGYKLKIAFAIAVGIMDYYSSENA